MQKAGGFQCNLQGPDSSSGEYFTPPESERSELLKYKHLKGHFASEAMLQSLERKGECWKNPKKEADEFVQACVPGLCVS